MRTLLFAALCISMIGYIVADDLILGERQTGDYVITNRTIVKPAIPWVPMKAYIGVTGPSPDEIITQVKIINIGVNKADFVVMKGDIGTNSILIIAQGKMGEGLNVSVEGFAINPLTTTEAPTTTEQPTIAPTTTTTKRPETTHAPTEPPTTTEQPTIAPTTTTTKRPETTHAPTEAPTTTEQPTIAPITTTTRRPETTPAPTKLPTEITTEEPEGTTVTIDSD